MDAFTRDERLAAVEELAWRTAQWHGLDERRAVWVRNAARWEFVSRGSAWLAVKVASDYAKNLAGAAA